MPLSPEFFHLTEHSRQGVAYCWARACRILAGRAAHVPRLSCWGAPWGFPSAWRLAWINACPLALWSSNNGNGSSDICGYTHCKLSFAIAMLTYLRVVRYALYRLGITWFIKGIMKHKPTSNCTITPTKTERVTFQFNPTYHLATGATSVGSFPHTYILEMTCSPYTDQ